MKLSLKKRQSQHTSAITVTAAISMLLLTNTSMAATPALSISHQVDRGMVKQLIKTDYELCKLDRETLERARHDPTARAIYEINMQARREESPQYSLDNPLAPPPSDDALVDEYIDEFFDGKRYARYTTSVRYRLIGDGSCRFIKEEKYRATVDDGEKKYTLDFTDNRTRIRKTTVSDYLNASRKPGLIDAIHTGDIRRDQACVMLSQLLKAPPQNETLDIPLCGFKQATLRDLDIDLLQTQTRQTTTSVNEACDTFTIKGLEKSELCLWQVMHHYPAPPYRPIILSKKIILGKAKQPYRQQAIHFQPSERLPDSLFSPKTQHRANKSNEVSARIKATKKQTP